MDQSNWGTPQALSCEHQDDTISTERWSTCSRKRIFWDYHKMFTAISNECRENMVKSVCWNVESFRDRFIFEKHRFHKAFLLLLTHLPFLLYLLILDISSCDWCERWVWINLLSLKESVLAQRVHSALNLQIYPIWDEDTSHK